MKKILTPLLPLTLVGLLTAAPALSAGPAMLLILDASGSMWGRVDQQPKIAVAKTILQDLLSDTPATVGLGLIAYGHRRKGDCGDIELIASPGNGREALGVSVAALNPKGMTPISAALARAGQVLAGKEEATTLVLVSDGLETCGGDPCATARDLRAQGIEVVIHVVGFDVDAKTTDQLQCIAAAGGGRYFPAANASALQAALNQVKTAVVDKRPLPAAPSPPQVAETKVQSQRIRIAGPGTVKIRRAAWLAPPRYWALLDAESGEQKGRTHEDQTRIKAGEYQVLWRQSEHGHSEVGLTEVVKVVSGQTREVSLDTGLRLTLPAGMAAPRWWGLAEPGADKPFFTVSRSLEPQLVPAGDYRLLWRQEEHDCATVDLGPISIADGQLNDRVLNQGILLQPADWLGEITPYYYRLLNAAGEIVGSWNQSGPQLAPLGDYTLIYRPSQHQHREFRWGRVQVTGEGITPIPLDSGIRFLPAGDAQPPYAVILVNLDDGQEISMGNTWDPLPLPPGRYRLYWHERQHATQRETLADEILIEPGTLVEVAL